MAWVGPEEVVLEQTHSYEQGPVFAKIAGVGIPAQKLIMALYLWKLCTKVQGKGNALMDQ
eukprot:131917-Ditylum_brightwellii.AAC.1